MDRRSLAVCAVFRNEAPYLLEWIAYHRAIGFDRFVLYDSGSTDGGANLVRTSPMADRVTVIHWPQGPGQLSAYRHFIDIFAPAYDWAAFIDTDEFILPLDGTLSDTLQRCGQASAVLVNWRVFGPAGQEEPPPGLAIETYDLRSEDSLPVNRHAKSIVRCADLLDVGQTPHTFRLKGPACNPLGQEVPNAALQPAPCHHGLVINHYYTRSRREWLARLHDGEAVPEGAGPDYIEEMFDQLAAVCLARDDAIKAYVPQVKALLADHGAERPAAEAIAAASAAAHPATSSSALQDAGRTMLASLEPGILTPHATDPSALGQDPSMPAGAPHATPDIIPVLATHGAEWRASGADAKERRDGLALVFRDHSRPAAPWLAALRGRAAGLIDPDFLLDEFGRLREFLTEEEARAACRAVLVEYQLA